MFRRYNLETLGMEAFFSMVNVMEIGGSGGNRTPIQGFAVLCVTIPPRNPNISYAAGL